MKPGEGVRSLPEELWPDGYRKRAFRRVQDGTPTEKRGGAPSGIRRLHPDCPSLTITGGSSREFVHPYFNRWLTLRECARLQTFPDSYQFSGSFQSIAQQIGNAVPPMAAEIIGRHILKIDGLAGSDVGRLETQRKPQFLAFSLSEGKDLSPALKKTHLALKELMIEKRI